MEDAQVAGHVCRIVYNPAAARFTACLPNQWGAGCSTREGKVNSRTKCHIASWIKRYCQRDIEAIIIESHVMHIHRYVAYN